MAANKILGACWTLVDKSRLGPPLVPKILLPPIGILTTSNQGTPKQMPQVHTKAFQFFLNKVKKSPISSLDLLKAKALRWYSTYISFHTCPIDQGCTPGDN